jgi:EAL domain-containing protein (putative c-di-GMP-specific phosphodiesterase class I)
MAYSPFSNRLLVVDDEPAFGRLVKKVAEGMGFEVVATEDPRAFAKTARSWHPDVIITDLNMPGVDGIQLLRSLAADKCAASIVLASGSDSKVLEAAMQLGRERGLKMSDVLQKPVRVDTLRDLLGKLRPVTKTLLSDDLGNAILADHLFLEYQPKLDLKLGRFTGVEALVRWRHPEHGLIRPDQFIPLAEQTELIHRLTDWVVASAVQQSALWRAENLALDVAVNISAKDIEDLDLPDRLQQHCSDAGVAPASIIIELTETGAMREAVQMMDVLTRLRLKGFTLSIDDFGTGYSSLVQLQKMPFSEVKIDRAFVMQMMSNKDCKVIVEIIIDLARRLGLESVAEGVEEEAALNCLAELGCDVAQGYHLSRPVAADRIPELVRGYEAAGVKTAVPVASARVNLIAPLRPTEQSCPPSALKRQIGRVKEREISGAS